MNDYGQIYKKLRKKYNLTLEQASKDIVDSSTLSRWENGKGDMYFDKVIQLLQKVNIYPDEFIMIAKQYSNERRSSMFSKLRKAYTDKDQVELYKLVHIQMKYYEETKDKTDLFMIVTVCCAYKDLTDKNILPKNYEEELRITLNNVSDWNEYYSRIFGNSVEVLDNEQIFQIMKKIVVNVNKISKIDIKRENGMINSALNGYIRLIKVGDVNLAKKAKTLFSNIEIPRYLMYTKVKLYFFNNLLDYQLGNAQAIPKMEKVIQLLEAVGYSDYARELVLLFKQISGNKKSMD